MGGSRTNCSLSRLPALLIPQLSSMILYIQEVQKQERREGEDATRASLFVPIFVRRCWLPSVAALRAHLLCASITGPLGRVWQAQITLPALVSHDVKTAPLFSGTH